MLETHEARSPASQRFVLAGVLASVDDGTIVDVLEAVSGVLRKRVKELSQ